MTYYAQWTLVYTVTFDGNGGSGHTPTTKSVAYNTAVGTLPTTPIRTGYDFAGWFTSGGAQITTATLITGAVTYYAQWTDQELSTWGDSLITPMNYLLANRPASEFSGTL